jgi:single-strand DNA-binding protein
MNKIILSGRWSKDIELKFLPDGTAVAKSTIAVDEGYGDKKKAHFFNVTMWKKTAEAVANYSGKGKKVLIEGRLQQRMWEKDGVKQYAIEVVAEQVEFLEMKTGETKKDVFAEDQKNVDISDLDLPF